jgi:ABC-type lipoprotein release transport system permease subunit
MFMFLKLAWGNVLKNRRSSITILIVVFVCVFFMDFGVAFMDGFKSKILGDFLNEAGHINIYDSRYYKEMDFVMNEYNVNLTPELLKAVKTVPGVKTVRAEINFGAIANTQTENLECMVRAIDPENASDNYTKLASSVIKGSFIKGDKDILVGERGAKLLGTGIGQKLVILSVDQYGKS